MKLVDLILLFSLMSPFCSPERPSVDGPHRWTASSIEFYLNKEANFLTETVVRETFQNWAEKTHFSFVYKGRNKAGIIKDGKNTVSFLIRWPNDIPINKTAYCRSWYGKNGNIIESDIIFNMQLARFTTLRTNKPDSYFIEGVLSHEIGHMIGFNHIDNKDSLMKSFSPLKESYFKGKIDNLTINAYRELYSAVFRIKGGNDSITPISTDKKL